MVWIFLGAIGVMWWWLQTHNPDRLVVYCATLIAAGVSIADAVLAGMIEPLTDDTDVKAALLDVARAVIG